MTKISDKWRRIAEIYKIFLEKDWVVDLSEDAALEMYLYESTGQGKPTMKNGYFVGKKWMDVFITQYKRDIKEGLLFPFELRETFPDWWLVDVGLL